MSNANSPLKGLKALVTAGPTFEPIDPVRFIGNRSSGKQGYAIATALANAGADVTLISGPTALNDPANLKTQRIETACDMLDATQNALPADIAIFTAAVSDWSPDYCDQKIKKNMLDAPPNITLKENPDILKTLSNHDNRPKLVIGFAAETQNLIDNAKTKLKSKNCDWIVANDVSQNIFGSDENHAYLITPNTQEEWPRTGKDAIAEKLVEKIIEFF